MPIMQTRPASLIVLGLLILILAGCAAHHETESKEQTTTIRHGGILLSVTNAEPGSTYELGVYVISAGDTAGKICERFQITRENFLTMNPDLNPNRLLIGQKVRVYETKKN
jgi:LysM repeat protein